jgi:L-fuconolactonase
MGRDAVTSDPVTIDAHHHLWDLSRGYDWLDEPSLSPIRRSYGLADLESVTAAAGVDRTVLVEAGRCDTGEAAEFLALAQGSELIAGVVAWASLTDPDLPAVLAGYRELPGSGKLVGIRDQVQGRADPDFLDRPDVQRGLSTIASADLVNELVVRSDQLPSAARAALVLPESVFVLDHLGKPSVKDGAAGLERWIADVKGFAAQPNTVAKISGLVTEADWAAWTIDDLRPFVDAALELFGPSRLMAGSDWPVCEVAASYGDVFGTVRELLSELSRDERDAVFGGTAVRVYGLTV